VSVRAPSEKNFRRARVRPGKRRSRVAVHAWRVTRAAATLLIIAYAGYRGTSLVLHASSLQVQHISVHGNVRLSGGEVQAIIDDLEGSSILTADLPRSRMKLLQSPWIADVALHRVLPSTIEVFVSERRPMGLCRLGSTLYLIDPQGAVIDEFGPKYSEFDLPIIDGLTRGATAGQPAIDADRADLAGRVIDAVAARRDIARRISQIDVSDVHDAVVLLENDSARLHLGEERFLERVQSYVDLAQALHDRVPRMDYVDLRFEDRVYVRPAGGK
jgi:cell division septal protein FtsQ